ncbi:zinc protease [Pseudarcicella hirudinis]|uniref:Zinc protease n=2 Tax=Pseudarcicella hirudinis TaxID=1079859 RepID=A0A1I5PJ17_9BACT|nr:pitrilysin family protein [Pseudarcicella hirudinis]SFP33847.1 zinc protease [Pseudarcicella hirudinis]
MLNLRPLLLIGSMAVCLPGIAQKKTTKSQPGPATDVAVKSSQKAVTLPAPEKVTSAEGITEYKLANGLRVLLFPDPSKQTVTVNITYLVGSRNEGYGETGMSHLLEHLVFKGTPKHQNIPQELTSHGARPNGTTWNDRTNYFETFAATDENLEWALDLESDRMINSYIAKKDLDTEMTVVRNEFEMGENDPGSILLERVFSTAYLWHNYGNSTIGARSDIEKVPIENLQAYYHKYYQPDNAVLLVAGKIDPDKVLKMVNEKFGVIPRPARKLDLTHTEEPTQDGERQVTLRRTGDVQYVITGYHIPSALHPDYVVSDIMLDILTDAPSGRLYKALIDTKLATQQYGGSFQTKEPSLAFFGAEILKDKSIDSVKTVLIDVVENFGKTAPTKEEVDRSITKQLKNIDLLLNNTERVGTFLSEFIALGDWRMIFYLRDQYKKVKPEDVQKVAQKYLRTSNRTLGLFYPTEKPERAEIPEAQDVTTLLKDFKGGTGVAQGEVFDPSPSNIDSRTVKSDIGGVKLSLLQKKTRGNVVNANLTLRFGDEKSLTGKSVIADYTADLLTKGTTKHTRQEWKDELDKLKARVNFTGGPTQVNITIETTKENFPAALKLVVEALKEPVFPADELEKLRQENISALETQKSDPQGKVTDAMAELLRFYPKGHPNYQSTIDEKLVDYKAVKLDEVKQFYKDFYGASNAILSVVGDFDEKALKDIVTADFSNWKSPKPFTRVANPYHEVKAQNKSVEAPDKANAFFIAIQPLKISETDPDYAALTMANYMLGGGFLNSRLATRIRQKEGISYGVGSQLSAHPIDNSGTFLTYAIYAPENAARLEAAFKEEMEKTLKDGFTATELEEARKGYLQSRQVGRAQDNALSGKLANYAYLNRTLKWDEDFENKIKALTPESILTAMRKNIDLSKISILKSGDFEGAAKKAAEKKTQTGAMEGAPKKD